MNGLPEAVLVAATVGNGLLAVLFFAFSWGVVPGLRRVDDLSYVTGIPLRPGAVSRSRATLRPDAGAAAPPPHQ